MNKQLSVQVIFIEPRASKFTYHSRSRKQTDFHFKGTRFEPARDLEAHMSKVAGLSVLWNSVFQWRKKSRNLK